MGKQVQFFTVLEDIAGLFSLIMERGHMILSKKNERIFGLGEELKAAVCSRMGLLVYISGDRFAIEKTQQGYVDPLGSEVVELSSGGYNKNKRQIDPGRLYINMNGFKDDKFFRKTEELDRIYEFYKRYIVRTFQKSVGSRSLYYIGPKAHELYENGWKMMSGPKIEIIF